MRGGPTFLRSSALRRCTITTPMQRHPLESNFSPVARWLQWQTRPPIEEEFALDHGETATTPNRAAKVIFDAEQVTRGDGDSDIIALPDLLPGPEARQRWIAFIGGVRHRCTKHRQRSDTG